MFVKKAKTPLTKQREARNGVQGHTYSERMYRNIRRAQHPLPAGGIPRNYLSSSWAEAVSWASSALALASSLSFTLT